MVVFIFSSHEVVVFVLVCLLMCALCAAGARHKMSGLIGVLGEV